MSKYGKLRKAEGNSKWFLQRTLDEHDRSMDHPWMKMIYSKVFSIKQYASWLAQMHAVFQRLEQHLESKPLEGVHDAGLLRTPALESDLQQLLGSDWREQANKALQSCPAAQQYLEHLEEDALDVNLLLAHHFLNYNAVLSGGEYLGRMVSEKLCVPHGAPGVRFYCFDGVSEGKGPSRVQKYLASLDTLEISIEDREHMLATMRRIYTDTEAMMTEVYNIQPVDGHSYHEAKAASDAEGPPKTLPEHQLVNLTLDELKTYTGSDNGRILICLAGELLDVSAGRDVYGPGCSYALLAGHDVTRCLANMSLEPSELDDLGWEPTSEEDETALQRWREKLTAKYPVAGKLVFSSSPNPSAGSAVPQSKSQTNSPGSTSESAPAIAKADATFTSTKKDAQQACPISGKVGTCPMAAIMGGGKASAAPKAKASSSSSSTTSKGFMAGKSLVASVNKDTSSQDSLFYRLCPLHWDDKTMKMLVVVAVASWLNGVLIGWKLHAQMSS